MSMIRRLGVMLGVGLWVASHAIGQPQKPGAAAPVVADSFGTGAQELLIGAAAFQHLSNNSGYEIDWSTDGYLGYTDESFLGVFVAPLQLPAGAEILAICTHLLDTAPVGAVTTYLDAVKLASQGTSPGVVPVFGPVEYDTDGGYAEACWLSTYTYRNFADLDGDGSEEFIVHRLRVEMTETGAGRLAFGGVRVVWRRQVSPPPSSATFGDVSTDHAFFQFIEALSQSEITSGCGSGNYCPDAPLTRGQMAVFLSKALGLHWPN